MSAMVVDTNQRNDIQIVNDLMHYSINNAEVSIQDQQFYECAVKSLIRRLRRRNGSFLSLGLIVLPKGA